MEKLALNRIKCGVLWHLDWKWKTTSDLWFSLMFRSLGIELYARYWSNSICSLASRVIFKTTKNPKWVQNIKSRTPFIRIQIGLQDLVYIFCKVVTAKNLDKDLSLFQKTNFKNIQKYVNAKTRKKKQLQTPN